MEKLELLPINLDDLPHIRRWKEDAELSHALLTYPKSSSESEIIRWFEKNSTDDCQVLRGIYLMPERTLIGIARLMFINKESRNCELGVYLGEQSQRRSGYGRAAVQQLLQIAFNELNLHKVFLRVGESNEAAISLYSALGFSQEGRMREQFCWDAEFENVVLMGILSSEYSA